MSTMIKETEAATVQDLAKLAKISEAGVYYRLKSGMLPRVGIGLYDISDKKKLNKFLKRNNNKLYRGGQSLPKAPKNNLQVIDYLFEQLKIEIEKLR